MLVILGIMMKWLNLNTRWMHCEYCDAMVINWVCLWFEGGSLELVLVLGQSLFFFVIPMDSTPILEFNLKLFTINGLTRDVTMNIKK
jgi:hypothetical protein